MSTRTEYGFPRPQDCSCAECARYCKTLPGFLIPADISRIASALGYASDTMRFADENLLASPGAVVMYDGKLFRIPTLVPAKNASGCKFLDGKNLCTIHEVSPFGCAFFDPHRSDMETSELAHYGLMEVWEDWKTNGFYRKTWERLFMAGKCAIDPILATKELWK